MAPKVMAGLGSPPQSPTPLQGSYCPGGAGPSTAPTGGSDTSTPAQCPAHTTSPAGSSTSTACLPVPGYYGPAGQAAQICPAVRALARSAPAGGVGISCTCSSSGAAFLFGTRTHWSCGALLAWPPAAKGSL